jgi:hypothetical protein
VFGGGVKRIETGSRGSSGDIVQYPQEVSFAEALSTGKLHGRCVPPLYSRLKQRPGLVCIVLRWGFDLQGLGKEAGNRQPISQSWAMVAKESKEQRMSGLDDAPVGSHDIESRIRTSGNRGYHISL